MTQCSRAGWHVVAQPKSHPAVYAIYVDGQLIYIGSAGNLAARLRSHELLQGFDRSRFVIKARYGNARAYDWLAREARLVKRLNPPMNGSRGRRVEVEFRCTPEQKRDLRMLAQAHDVSIGQLLADFAMRNRTDSRTAS